MTDHLDGLIWLWSDHPVADSQSRGTTRRAFVQRAALGVAALSGARGTVPSTSLASHEPPVKLVWTHAARVVRQPPLIPPNNPENQALHVTLIRADAKPINAVDRFYLWVWTHDAPICRLFTAPDPTGPYTDRGLCNVPAPPPGWKQSHFSSGDVVWDQVTGSLYSTPHGSELSSGRQATFLLRSSDGIHWSYVSTEPIVRPTPGFWAFDHVHVGYGRFLRTYDHNLVRIGGKAIWYYRGEEHPSAGTKKYRMGAATSSDLTAWTKVSTSPLSDPSTGGMFSLGSALYVNGRAHLIMNVGVGDSTTYVKQDAGDPLQFSNGAGAPIYNDPTAVFFTDGPNYFVDRRTDRHYLAYANGHLDNALTGQQHAEVHVALGT